MATRPRNMTPDEFEKHREEANAAQKALDEFHANPYAAYAELEQRVAALEKKAAKK